MKTSIAIAQRMKTSAWLVTLLLVTSPVYVQTSNDWSPTTPDAARLEKHQTVTDRTTTAASVNHIETFLEAELQLLASQIARNSSGGDAANRARQPNDEQLAAQLEDLLDAAGKDINEDDAQSRREAEHVGDTLSSSSLVGEIRKRTVTNDDMMIRHLGRQRQRDRERYQRYRDGDIEGSHVTQNKTRSSSSTSPARGRYRMRQSSGGSSKSKSQAYWSGPAVSQHSAPGDGRQADAAYSNSLESSQSDQSSATKYPESLGNSASRAPATGKSAGRETNENLDARSVIGGAVQSGNRDGERRPEANGREAAASASTAQIDPAAVYRTCDKMKCQRGGVCVAAESTSTAGARCRCPLGTRGRHCEQEITVRHPKFVGTGYLALPTLRGADREFIIDMEFRPDDVPLLQHKSGGNSRLLLFGSEHPDAIFDFFSVALIDGGYVEFRFDCGTGMGVARTSNAVLFGQWNRLRVRRVDWNGHVTLNDGPEVHVKSKGLFSKMKFRNELVLGGHWNVSLVSARTGISGGFVGCVSRLKINNKQYDMRQGHYVGDALHGYDVDECSTGTCDNVTCQNGGTCVTKGADSSTCLCSIGSFGDYCESKIDVNIPSFGGHSYLQYMGLRRSLLNYANIEMVFRPTAPDGLLLYDGYATDGTGDFLSLALRNSTVEFRFDLGTGPAVIRSAQTVTLNEWHVARLSRQGRQGSLRVDGQVTVNGTSPGMFTQLTLTLDMFVGGHRNFDEVAKNADIGKSFTGCIQKLVINERSVKLVPEALIGVNVDDCRQHPCSSLPCLNGGLCLPTKDTYRCRCPVGFDSINCEIKTARYRYRYRYRRDV